MPHTPRHPARRLILLFAATHLLFLALGGRFDADNLTSWMQIADVHLLKTQLLPTLWYLHSQPPLFNLLIGLALRLGDTGFLWAMGLLYAAVTLGGNLAFHALARDLTGRPRLTFVIAAWLCVAPSVLLFSSKLYYDGLVPWMLTMACWGLHHGLTRRRFAPLLFGFAMLAAVILLRSMLHPILYLAVFAIFLTLGTGQRARIARAAAAPAALLALLMLKNLLVFGTIGYSSWAALNLGHTTVDRLPMAEKRVLIAEGRMSRFAGLVDGFSPPQVYLAMLPPTPPTGQPSLDALTKSSGEANWNHIVYTRIGTERAHDALVALSVAPLDFARVLVISLYHFHRPSSEFKGLERNLAVIAGWERLANATIGLQPAAWAGRTGDPARPQAFLLQMSYTAWAVTLGFLGGAVLLLGQLLTHARRRTLPPATLATPIALALIGGFVLIVSSSFDVWENNRAHYDIAPVFLLVALFFVTKVHTMVGDRRNPH